MKKLVLMAVVMTGVSFSGFANAAIAPATEKDLVRICEALQSDSRLKLHKAMKKSRITYRTIAKGLVCNGQDAITFAQNHGATNTAELMARRGNVDKDSMVAKY